MKLTKREKLMIYILICLFACTIGWFLITKPIKDQYQSNQNLHEQLSNQLTVYNQQLATYQAAPEQLESIKEEYEQVSKTLGQTLSNEAIDAMITGEIMDYGFTPVSFRLGTWENVTLEDETVLEGILQNNVTITMTGVRANLNELMDHIASLDGIYIDQIRYSFNNNDQINIVFKLYRLES